MKILMMVLAISQPAYADISGEALFKTYCASCHGSNGEGSAIANFKISERLVKSDEELSKTIREGKGQMPAWGFLFSEEDIKNVLQYIRETFEHTDFSGHM